MKKYYVIIRTDHRGFFEYCTRENRTSARSVARQYRRDDRVPGTTTTLYTIKYKKDVSYPSHCWIVNGNLSKRVRGSTMRAPRHDVLRLWTPEMQSIFA